MRSSENPMAPEVAAALEAVDATLAGDPADPAHADLAELALILRDERPGIDDGFAAALDERAERRFARPARPAASAGGRRRPRTAWLWGPLAGLGAVAAAVLVVIVIAGQGGGGVNGVSSASSSATAASAPRARNFSGPRSAGAPAHRAGSASSAGASASAGSASAGSLSSQPPPAPANSGIRQIVQSAQLQLTTAPGQVNDVAQQVFGVVGTEKGIVNSSHVTATGNPDGYADFQLSIPSGALGQTLTALSQLHGARVASRTDDTTDITGKVGGAGQRLAEARALRRSLLKQLAAAVTTAQVNSLTARLHDADASIASDLSSLRGLKRQVAYSAVTVTIQAAAGGAAGAGGGGFTIGRAAHDAGRVLVVVAGAALIALAVLVPVGLVGALLAWAGLAVRRRRREQALDLV